MKASLIAFVFIWNLFAPSPPGIAMNPETKECGYYLGGDEHAQYSLPDPWIINYGEPVQTETGIFEWDGDISSIESFCIQLGYTFIPGNLASEQGKLEWSSFTYILLAVKFAPLIVIIILLLMALFLFLRWSKKRSDTLSAS